MAELVLERAVGWVDKLRAYRVVLDGKPAGTIRQGETVRLPIAAGPHTVQLRIDWCSSRAVTVSGNGEARLVCRAHPTPLTAFWYALFRRGSYIDLTEA